MLPVKSLVGPRLAFFWRISNISISPKMSYYTLRDPDFTFLMALYGYLAISPLSNCSYN